MKPSTTDQSSTAASLALRRLGEADRPGLLAHLQRLGEADRRLRFAACTTDEALAAHVAGLDVAACLCFGVFAAGGTLVAAVEGHAIGSAAGAPRCMELAFSTDRAWRRRGLAQALFEAAGTAAAGLRIDVLEARCDARDRPMRALLACTGAEVEADDGEVLGRWPLGREPAASAAVARFCHAVEVVEAHTARQLFATLPLGSSYAERLVDALSTGILVANIESACILEMQPHLAFDETVVGTDVQLRHLAPALPGRPIHVHGTGWRRGERDIRFDVAVDDAEGVIARGVVTLAVVRAARFEARLEKKGQPVRALAA